MKANTNISYEPHLMYHQIQKIMYEDLSSNKDLSLLAVKEEDIFLQFISEAKISDDVAQINLGKALYKN